MYVHLLPMTLPPYNHSWAEHIVSVLSFNSTSYRFSSATRRQIAFSVLSSLARCSSLPLLSLSCTFLVSPKSKRAVASPFCLPHLWCSMGHWLDNDRQAERGAVRTAKEGANQPTEMECKTPIRCLTQIYRRSCLCWWKLCTSGSRCAPYSSHLCECATCTVFAIHCEVLRRQRGRGGHLDNTADATPSKAIGPELEPCVFLSALPLFLFLYLVFESEKAQRLVKTLIYCTITVIE